MVISECRRLIGMAILALASAGPIPLWLHHQISHGEHSTCCGTSDTIAHDDTPSCAGATVCGSEHAAHATSIHQCSGGEHTEAAAECKVVGSEVAADAAVLIPADDHDCLVCYLLSQSASPAAVSHHVASAPVIESVTIQLQQNDASVIRSTHPPRGPPTA